MFYYKINVFAKIAINFSIFLWCSIEGKNVSTTIKWIYQTIALKF